MENDISAPHESPEDLLQRARQTLEESPEEISAVLGEMASRLVHFPAFLNMVSVQALELEPLALDGTDQGCLVVCPDGVIRRLGLSSIAGVPGVLEMDAMEQFQEVDLSPEEIFAYAAQAMELLYQEIKRLSKR